MNTEAFLLERYKYILEQKRSLNAATFKIVSILQLIVAAVATANFSIIKAVQSGEIDSDAARLAVLFCFVGSIFVILACLLSLVGGLASWLKYRRDEAAVEMQVHGAARPAPNFASIFRWYETYIILAAVVGAAGYCLALPSIIALCQQS